MIVLAITILLVFIFSGYIVLTYDTLNLFEYIFYVLVWAISAFLVIGAMYRVVKDSKNKKGINPFTKYYNLNEVDMFITDIQNIEGYKKIIKNNNGFILINEAGIFEIRFLYCKGTLKGDIKDKKWFVNTREIDNPFLIKDSLKYLVLTKNMLVNVSGIRLVTKTKLAFVLENHLNKRVMDKEQIDKIFNDIEVEYGYNQN